VPDDHRPPGITTVSTDVLVAIARMAALGVPGVNSVAPPISNVGRFFRRRAADGVRITIEDNLILGDIHLVVQGGLNIREVGRDVQIQVARALREMVGMDIGRIDIHVENIDFERAGA